jgi:hypothetical protein
MSVTLNASGDRGAISSCEPGSSRALDGINESVRLRRDMRPPGSALRKAAKELTQGSGRSFLPQSARRNPQWGPAAFAETRSR